MFERYAIYYTPKGALAQKGAAWLGWDMVQGRAVSHPDVGGVDLAMITQTPRKYGMHGTIKPPFFLAKGATVGDLQIQVSDLCTQLAPVTLLGLEVKSLAGFLALVPTGPQDGLAALAGQVVTQLDGFRAPPSTAELARRRKQDLNTRQAQHLLDWGYPYVMDEFRFHITLSGRLDAGIEAGLTLAQDYFAPVLPDPFVVNSLTLAGQDTDGMFHEIHRYALTG